MINFHLYDDKDIKKTLGKDFAWYNKGCRIKENTDWAKLHQVQDKLITALNAGKLTLSKIVNNYQLPQAYVIADGMIGGVFCPADGVTYDSKSSYYKAVKAKGCEIVGNEPIKNPKPLAQDVNWERAVAETLQQYN